jgi:hypothetical protein
MGLLGSLLKKRVNRSNRVELEITRGIENNDGDATIREMRALEAAGGKVKSVQLSLSDGTTKILNSADEAEEFFKSIKGAEDLNLDSIGDRPDPKLAAETVYDNGGVRNHSSCPHCGFAFDSSPRRGRKCPKCGRPFYVRPSGRLFNSDLLTPEQTYATDCFGEMMAVYDLKVIDGRKVKDALAQKWGKEPAPRDVLWALANALPQKFANDPDKLMETAKDRFYTFARYENARGDDPYSTLQKYAEASLEESRYFLKKHHIDQDFVYVCAWNCCDVCRSRHGKRVKIADAKAKRPIPFRDCQHRLKPADKYSFCMCYYSWVEPPR